MSIDATYNRNGVPSKTPSFHPPVPRRSKTGVFGTARRATKTDVRQFLSLHSSSEKNCLTEVAYALEREDGRGIEIHEQQKLYLPEDIREQNILVVGQIGSGKSQEILDPLFYSDLSDYEYSDYEHSVVRFCSKDDDEEKASRYVGKINDDGRFQVKVLNFANHWRTTDAWMPLLPDCKGDLSTLLDDVYAFIEASQSGHKQDYYFWKASAARLIVAAIIRVGRMSTSATPADVSFLLELPREKLLSVLTSLPDVPFAEACASYLKSGSWNAETILAFAQDYLSIFRDKEIAAATSRNLLDLQGLLEWPTLLLIECPQRNVPRIRPLLNLFAIQFFRYVARYAARQPGNRLPRPLSIFFDDFTVTLGKLPEFHQHVNLLRSCGVQFTAAVQSISQIEDTYGPQGKDVVAGFVTKIFKSPLDPEDAEYASRLSGTMTAEVHERVVVRRNGDLPGSDCTTTTIRPVARPLFLPEDVRLAPQHPKLGAASTVFLPNTPPFQAWFTPAHKHPKTAKILAAARNSTGWQRLSTDELTYEPIPDLLAVSGTGSTPATAEISLRTERAKQALSFATATDKDRSFWRTIEEGLRDRPAVLMDFVEELAKRGATVADVHKAHRETGSVHLNVLVAYTEYLRLAKQAQNVKQS